MTAALTYAFPETITVQRSQPVQRKPVLRSVKTVGDWRATVEERLRQLLQLPIGWDGYQSQPISPPTAQFVTDVLRSVMVSQTPAPAIVPVSGGGLQVEWHRSGLDIELYVAKPHQTELYVSFSDGCDVEYKLTSDFGALSNVLAMLAKDHE